MDLLTKAELLAECGEIRFIDFHFARQLKQLDSQADENTLLAAMLVSNQSGKGDVCINLQQLSEQGLFSDSQANVSISTPSKSTWLESLKNSVLVSSDDAVAPLTLIDDNFLFLTRYWNYERSLAADVVAKAISKPGIDIALLKIGLERYFSRANIIADDGDTDWQMLAAVLALLNKFTVITGGPGTGKTTTVTKILALFAEQNQLAEQNQQEMLARKKKIVLAAPTGKAANRLSESIKKAKVELDLAADVAQQIPDEVITIHRLLGTSSAKSTCFYNADNRLYLDLLVVDEASMIDLAMMTKLMQALPETAQIILLGDMNQLASVESGSVLADICATGMNSNYSFGMSQLLSSQFGCQNKDQDKDHSQGITHPLGDCVASLKKSYRFGSNSGIGKLANATNGSDPDSFFAAFSDKIFADISWSQLDSTSLQKSIDSIDIKHYRNYLQAQDAEQALQQLSKFQILSPVREGAFGVDNLNKLVKARLQRAGLISGNDNCFHGQPIMITENNYNTGLYNGDVGIIWNQEGELSGYFPLAEGGVKRFALAKLPAYETVFAMTVHKSQGSEFDNVLIVFPDKHAEHLTKELLYTAITRAKKSVCIWGKQDVMALTIQAKVNRNSLLQNELINRIAK